jgi:hypothetical protein
MKAPLMTALLVQALRAANSRAGATTAVAQPFAPEELETNERCRSANAHFKRARQLFRSLYFNIYIGRRQAAFCRRIHGVTEL